MDGGRRGARFIASSSVDPGDGGTWDNASSVVILVAYSDRVIACVPVLPSGVVDPRWGRADRVAVARVEGGEILSWDEYQVDWSERHDEGSGARHHARIARFLLDHKVQVVVAHHVGDGMVRQLTVMRIRLLLGAEGDARTAVLAALSSS